MELLNALTHIGFTEYEAKVYLALLSENPATGYQISKRSGVPRSMVYETLSRLHQRGAVMETVEKRATLYRPLPPATLLDRYESDHKRLVEDLRSGLNELYTEIDEARTWTINGREGILVYAVRMLHSARMEVSLVVDDPCLDYLREHITALDEAGVTINALLTGRDELNCGRVAYHPPLESELQGLTGTLLVVVDNKETLIASTTTDMRATITTHPNLVLIARQFVWMELFAQRIYACLGDDLIRRLDPEDQEVFESLKIDFDDNQS